jgi:hypothetical protein
VKTWERIQRKRRKALFLDSIDIELDKLAGTDIHNLETSLRAHAYEEKLKARVLYNPTLYQDMHDLLAEKLDPDWHPDLRTSLPYTSTAGNSERGLRQSTVSQRQPSLEPLQS